MRKTLHRTRWYLHDVNQPHYLGTTSRRKADKLSLTSRATLVGFVPAAVLRKELGCAELARHPEFTGHAVLISHLVDLTELVIGANLPSGSFHRGNEIRAIFFFAHLAFCGV